MIASDKADKKQCGWYGCKRYIMFVIHFGHIFGRCTCTNSCICLLLLKTTVYTMVLFVKSVCLCAANSPEHVHRDGTSRAAQPTVIHWWSLRDIRRPEIHQVRRNKLTRFRSVEYPRWQQARRLIGSPSYHFKCRLPIQDMILCIMFLNMLKLLACTQPVHN